MTWDRGQISTNRGQSCIRTNLLRLTPFKTRVSRSAIECMLRWPENAAGGAPDPTMGRPCEPALGRFLSVDPVDTAGQPIATLRESGPVNAYDLTGKVLTGVRSCIRTILLITDAATSADEREWLSWHG